jgi:hypothetical protein
VRPRDKPRAGALLGMKKNNLSKKLSLSKTTVASLSDRALADVAGGLQLTRPYTKVSVCVGGGCLTELC